MNNTACFTDSTISLTGDVYRELANDVIDYFNQSYLNEYKHALAMLFEINDSDYKRFLDATRVYDDAPFFKRMFMKYPKIRDFSRADHEVVTALYAIVDSYEPIAKGVDALHKALEQPEFDFIFDVSEDTHKHFECMVLKFLRF